MKIWEPKPPGTGPVAGLLYLFTVTPTVGRCVAELIYPENINSEQQISSRSVESLQN